MSSINATEDAAAKTAAPVKVRRKKVRSIRQGLLRSLLLVLGVLLFGSAWVIDQVIDKELYDGFDGELLAVAQSLATLTRQELHGVELHFSDAAMPKFQAAVNPDYFELKYTGGALIERSKSFAIATKSGLASGKSKPFEFQASLANKVAAFADVQLPDGSQGRMVRLRFQPNIGDSLEAVAVEDRPAIKPIELIVARDMNLLTGVEVGLHSQLIALVIALLVVTGAFIWWRVGRELKAIDQLAAQAQRIGQSQIEPAMSLSGVPRELLPLILRVNESSESIARAMDRERRWSRDLAHEMRTPISELKTMLDVARVFPNAYTPERVQSEASQIAVEMDALVSSLLLMARVESGLDQVSQQPVNISELCDAILSSVKDRAIDQWTMQLESALVVKSDAALVRMLISNLVGNARSYADPRSEVYLKSSSKNGKAFFEIKNRAPHLQAADLAQMTQRFWRKAGIHENSIRSGMGLSIAQALCDILALKLSFTLDEDQFFSVRIDGWELVS